MRGLIMAAQQQQKKEVGIKPTYIYGVLYNWWAAADSRIANSGFTVPTNAEWTAMINYVNTTYNVSPNDFGVGNHLKSCRQVDSPLGGDCATSVHPRWDFHLFQWGRDTLRLGILPSGFRSRNDGSFLVVGIESYLKALDDFTFYYVQHSNGLFRSAKPASGADGMIVRFSRLATTEELAIPENQIIANYYKGNNDFLYDCIRINDRIWTAQNLAETHWNDGTDIPFAGVNGVNFDNAEWAALTTPGVCAYNNDVNTWGYTL